MGRSRGSRSGKATANSLNVAVGNGQVATSKLACAESTRAGRKEIETIQPAVLHGLPSPNRRGRTSAPSQLQAMHQIGHADKSFAALAPLSMVDSASVASEATASTAASTPTNGFASIVAGGTVNTLMATTNAVPLNLDSLTVVSNVYSQPTASSPVSQDREPVLLPAFAGRSLAVSPTRGPEPWTDAGEKVGVSHSSGNYRKQLRSRGLFAMRRSPLWRPYAVADSGGASPFETDGSGFGANLPPAQALGLVHWSQNDSIATASVSSVPAQASVLQQASTATSQTASCRVSPCQSPSHASSCGSNHVFFSEQQPIQQHGQFVPRDASDRPVDVGSIVAAGQLVALSPGTLNTSKPSLPLHDVVAPPRSQQQQQVQQQQVQQLQHQHQQVQPQQWQQSQQQQQTSGNGALLSIALGGFTEGLSSSQVAEQLRAAAAQCCYED